jgi:hypothetical protein
LVWPELATGIWGNLGGVSMTPAFQQRVRRPGAGSESAQDQYRRELAKA